MKWFEPLTVQLLFLLLRVVGAEEWNGNYEIFNEAFKSVPVVDKVHKEAHTIDLRERIRNPHAFNLTQLPTRGFPSDVDSMCVVLRNSDSARKWIELTRTEIVERTSDPDFATKIILNYNNFEEYLQPLLFKCYKIEQTSLRLEDEDLLGFVSITLEEMDHKESILKLELEPKVQGSTFPTSSSGLWWSYSKKRRLNKDGETDVAGKPHIIIRKEKLKNCPTQNLNRIAFVLRASNILVPSRSVSSSWLDIYQARDRTTADIMTLIMRIRVPELIEEGVSISSLEALPADTLKFVCKYRCERTQQRRIVGQFETSIAEIENDGRRTFELLDPRKKKGDIKYKNSGIVHILDYHGIYHSFLEYMKGGLNLHFNIGIDFSDSNSDLQRKTSLNHIKSSFLNHYERAIFALVSIIEEYDADRRFPVLGFGATLSHEEERGAFYVDPVNHLCSGIDGVLEAYRKCLSRVTKLAKAAHFAPVIRRIIHDFVRGHDYGDDYFVLLILTERQHIEEILIEETERAVMEEVSELPLSVIIVGTGEEKFQASGRVNDAKFGQDNFHFISLNQIIPTTRKRLTKALLAEVPRQVVTYMTNRHLEPKSPRYSSAKLPPHPAYL